MISNYLTEGQIFTIQILSLTFCGLFIGFFIGYGFREFMTILKESREIKRKIKSLPKATK